MSNYDKNYISQKAGELNFIRDTLEKVYRLADILEYLNTNPLLKESLALKGGTAINLTIFSLPRLSVDIDLDYMKPVSKGEMLLHRELINNDIFKYMNSTRYALSPKSKSPHSLDSWVFEYVGSCGGNRDNIKIEINYSMRHHILPALEMPIVPDHFSSEYRITSLSAIEIFASKINALLGRAAARDLYDVCNMIHFGLFDKSDYPLLRKSVAFYAAISAKTVNKTFDMSAIDKLTNYKIRTDLLPVLRKKEPFDLEASKTAAKIFISNLMVLSQNEQEFLNAFENKEYKPELLFEDVEILKRIKDHPMALWKTAR